MRVKANLLVTLLLATLFLGEALRSAMALRGGSDWPNLALGLGSGVMFYVFLIVLLRVVVVCSRRQGRPGPNLDSKRRP